MAWPPPWVKDRSPLALFIAPWRSFREKAAGDEVRRKRQEQQSVGSGGSRLDHPMRARDNAMCESVACYSILTILTKILLLEPVSSSAYTWFGKLFRQTSVTAINKHNNGCVIKPYLAKGGGRGFSLPWRI